MGKTLKGFRSSFIKNEKKQIAGDQRTQKIKKNILASFIFKGVDILIYLLLVPLTLGYLNPYEYGIWLTLNSILMWIDSFDIGLGNGLRNKLTIALARNDKPTARIYVSTTFYTLILIVSIIFSLFYLLNYFLDWYSILNVGRQDITDLNGIVIISFTFFCLNFVFKFVGNVYLALQLPAVNSFLTVLGHAISLIVIYVLSLFTSGSLLYVAVSYSAAPVIIYMLAYPVTFTRVCSYLAPSLKRVKLIFLKDLMGIGIKFFFLQIASIVLFASSNIILSRLLGPESVTPYNIAYRYFTVIPLVFTILIAPMWSAVTDAYTKGDVEWIKTSVGKIRKILFFTSILIAVMIALSNIIYYLWIGDQIEIPFDLTIMMGIYIYILIWSMSYSNFLNGLGYLKLQIINIIMVALLFYPLALLFIRYFELTGMVMTMALVNLSGAILNTAQFNKIIAGEAKGIWSK